MKDIAVRAGVSQATVSHALRGTGRLADDTRATIRKLAEEMGFREDPMMGALAAYRNRREDARRTVENIAFLYAAEPAYNPENARDLQALRAGIVDGAERWGFHVETLAHEGGEESCRRLTRILRNRGVRGVILYFARPSEKLAPRELDWDKFAVVACRPIFSRQLFHSVSTDHFANGRILYAKLRALGYRRIGFGFSEALDLVTNRAFKAGVWAEEQAICPPGERIEPLIMATWEQNLFDAWFRKWTPEALITQNWRIYFWLKALGKHVPTDVGVAVPYSTDSSEFYSGMNPRFRLMGSEAVRLLREQIILGNYGPPEFPFTIHIPSNWHGGQSLAPLSKTKG
ncbi:MAG: LacI family DNA-binding transcriptional regulator [Opitutales bacterium]|nr:LacI family DNA-binding transcriptional regulator [Opitutales bacterium]